MKTKLITLLGAALIMGLAFVPSIAQSSEEPAVKILPTGEDGIVKVVYAYKTDEAVEVNFYSKAGFIQSDKINARSFNGGFIKRYDLRNLNLKKFQIEVDAPNLKATYMMALSQDGKNYEATLEQLDYKTLTVTSSK